MRQKNLLLVPVLLAGLGLMQVCRVAAQIFETTTLHNFTGGIDGAYPVAGLTLSGKTLYGTTSEGGDTGNGTVFSLSIDGTGFTTLHSFAGGSGGGGPWSGLILSGNTLYGTALGGNFGSGTVFKLKTDGTGFSNLYHFSLATNVWGVVGLVNADGAEPEAGLILAENTLYGTASTGGPWGGGTVFKVKTDGTGYTVLHSFSPHSDLLAPYDNYDGAKPLGGALVLSGKTLCGTAELGGNFGVGTVFAVNTDGTGFKALHSFSNSLSDGAFPLTGVFLSGNTLYGTTGSGGTIFKVNTDGTGYEVIHRMSASDGEFPYTSLIASNNTVYGGTVFSLLGLVTSSNVLYGMAEFGGGSGKGTVFSISFPPPTLTMKVIPAGPHIRLFWSTNATGYVLQSTPSLVSHPWTNVTPAPVIADGQNAVSKLILGEQQFFRLSQE